jgi:cyanate permease
MAAWGWPAMFLAGAALAFASCVGLLLTCRGEAPGVAGWRLPSLRECRLVMVAGLIWTAYNAGYYGFLSYLPAYAAVRGHSPALVAAILAGATWLNLPFTLLGGSLAGRFGGTAVFAAGTAAFTLAVLGPALSDHLVLWGGLFGSLGAMHAGVIVAVGTLSARPENRATGMGLFYSTYYLGGAMLPALCGWAADRAGDASGAFVMAAALSALAVPAWILHRRMMRKTAV